MDWLILNWAMILDTIAKIVAIASVIVRMTPSESDNVALAKFVKLFELISLNRK